MTAIERLHCDLSDDLNRIARRFKTSVKLTLVIRQPEVDGDTGIVIGNDDYELAIAEVRRQAKTGTRTGARPLTEADVIEALKAGAAVRKAAERYRRKR
jgi:hypothetical protein